MTILEVVLAVVAFVLVAGAGNAVGAEFVAPWVGKNPNRFWCIVGGVLVVLATIAYVGVTSRWEGGIR